MNLPPLTNWQPSANSLHRAAQLLGAIRMLVFEPKPNYLELALRIEPSGLSTARLPAGGEVQLDFNKAAIVCTDKAGNGKELALNLHSQASLLEEILATLETQGQGIAKKDDTVTSGFLAALHAKGHKLEGSLQVGSEEVLELDPELSAGYGKVLWRVFSATARWRARLVGPQTPIVVWPEHFDLSTLWFATDKATDAAPHMNFGFAPFDSVHPRPYLYAYAYPMPEGFEQRTLPQPAHWVRSPWKGMVVPYDDLAKAKDPDATIARLFEAAYDLLSPSLQMTPTTSG